MRYNRRGTRSTFETMSDLSRNARLPRSNLNSLPTQIQSAVFNCFKRRTPAANIANNLIRRGRNSTFETGLSYDVLLMNFFVTGRVVLAYKVNKDIWGELVPW